MNRHLIWVKAKCNNYYNFMVKLQYLQIVIDDIKYAHDFVYLKIAKEDLAKLEKYLVSYQFKVEKETGIFLIGQKIKENHVLVLMLFIGLIFYLLFTNLIIKINVVHENKEIRELILDELEMRGVKVLSFKKSYQKLNQIKEEIKDKYPDKIDWLEIEEHGMTYDVKIEERIITDTTKTNKTCDIVAKKNGRIKNIKLAAGEVLVDIDDYVREGDKLISGKIIYNEEEKRNICAQGEIYAEVWYTVNISIPWEYKEYIKTGKSKYNLVWETKKKKRKILKDRYLNYQSDYKTLLKIFDFSLYLEKENETKQIKQKYTEKEALEQAILLAQDKINKKIGEKDHIIDEKVLKKSLNDSTMDVEVFVIVEELISMEKETVMTDLNEN